MPMLKDDETNMDSLFIVHEYFGVDLATVISQKDKWQLTEDQIKHIIYNLLCAVKYIHSGTIVHRNLNPSNVLIDKNSWVKLKDFSSARSIATKTMKKNKLKKEIPKTPRVGTEQYMAPEMIISNKHQDFAVDIWGVGCILGELLLNFVEQDQEMSQSQYSSSCENMNSVRGLFSQYAGDVEQDSSQCSSPREDPLIFTIKDHDHMVQILDLIGCPAKEDIHLFTSKDNNMQSYLDYLIKSQDFKS